MSDYLWDKSGEPDPEVQRLETLLAPLRYRARVQRGAAWVALAVAASLAAAGLFAWQFSRPAWRVVDGGGPGKLSQGQTLRTNASSTAKLELSNIGQIEVGPNSEVRVLSMRANDQRLDLKRGMIHAFIWGPPGRFFVNTPSAVAVDLGCAYTLTVDENGAGRVKVTAGWVAFASDGRQSFIPASAACSTRPHRGPGLPYFEDASPDLRDAVEMFDRTSDARAVTAILDRARPRDGLTLWHLLQRAPDGERPRVYNRLAKLLNIPEGKPATMEALWDALGLGSIQNYRLAPP